MPQLENLKKIFIEEVIIKSESLIEKGKDHLGNDFSMKRNIRSHRGIDYLLFRLDPNKIKPFPYFNKDIGLSKICDYIMFVQKSNTLFVILIELKLGNDSATEQLLASEEFSIFIINSCKRVGLILTEDIRYKKVKISESALTRPKTSENMCKIDENNIIHYNHKNEFQIMEILHL